MVTESGDPPAGSKVPFHVSVFSRRSTLTVPVVAVGVPTSVALPSTPRKSSTTGPPTVRAPVLVTVTVYETTPPGSTLACALFVISTAATL